MLNKFLSSLPKLPDAAQMKEWDQASIDFGMPEEMLMENAAKEAFTLLEDLTGPVSDKTAAIFMGGGNNGGDASCVARYIKDKGGNPIILHVGKLNIKSKAAALHVTLAKADDVQFVEVDAENYAELKTRLFKIFDKYGLPEIFVDGLLGTGFEGELRPGLRNLISVINELSSMLRPFTLALDMPSGLNCRTGLPCPIAVQANATATFVAAKPGLVLPHAKQWTGNVYVRHIGMPMALQKKFKTSFYLLDGRILRTKTAFAYNTYKNAFGHVLIFGGAGGLSGAAHLTAAAALRSGAGLVTVCAPACNLANIKSDWPEIMTASVNANTDDWPVESLPENIRELLNKASAIVIGPGMGRGEDSLRFLKMILEWPYRPPAVIDADAIIALAKDRMLLEALKEKDILTPHPGEAAALLETSAQEVQSNREKALAALCKKSKSVYVLKGACTLIGQAGQAVILCPYDIPQLAIAGAGDVLSGCIGALLAKRPDGSIKEIIEKETPTMQIAAMGVITHVVAGLICAKEFPNRGDRASDLLAELPWVREYLSNLPFPKTGLTPWP